MRSVVSPLPCKGLESQHYILATVKTWRNWRSVTFCEPIKKLTLQGKLSQENLEKSLETNRGVLKWQIWQIDIIWVWTTWETLGGFSLKGTLHFHGFYLQVTRQIVRNTLWGRRKESSQSTSKPFSIEKKRGTFLREKDLS